MLEAPNVLALILKMAESEERTCQVTAVYMIWAAYECATDGFPGLSTSASPRCALDVEQMIATEALVHAVSDRKRGKSVMAEVDFEFASLGLKWRTRLLMVMV